jgi:hypothetical protein
MEGSNKTPYEPSKHNTAGRTCWLWKGLTRPLMRPTTYLPMRPTWHPTLALWSSADRKLTALARRPSVDNNRLWHFGLQPSAIVFGIPVFSREHSFSTLHSAALEGKEMLRRTKARLTAEMAHRTQLWIASLMSSPPSPQPEYGENFETPPPRVENSSFSGLRILSFSYRDPGAYAVPSYKRRISAPPSSITDGPLRGSGGNHGQTSALDSGPSDTDRFNVGIGREWQGKELDETEDKSWQAFKCPKFGKPLC